MTGFPLVPIKELVSNVSSWNPHNSSTCDLINYIDISSINQQSKEIDSVTQIHAHEAPSRARQLVTNRDVLVSTVRPNLNAVAKVPAEFDGYTASTGFCVLRPISNKLSSKYLHHWVKTDSFIDNMVSRATGASYPAVSDKIIKESSIPLPPLPEQERIATILDKAEAIRRKRQQAIRLADDFLRATFLDMFGDPVTNPNGWEVKKFSTIGTLDRGVSKHRPRNASELLGGAYPLIQTGDVANSNGYIHTYKSTYSEAGLRQSKIWSTGTLCITIAANIAKTSILTFDACFPDSVVGFSPNILSTTEYVQYWLGFLQKILEDGAPESAQKNINLQILRNLDIPLPPVSLQKEFSTIANKVKGIKTKLSISNNEMATLFSSLTQRAFRGEL